MIEIRFKDIDPDTGVISQDKLIASCEDERSANWVLHALRVLEHACGEPNRTIYQVKK